MLMISRDSFLHAYKYVTLRKMVLDQLNQQLCFEYCPILSGRVLVHERHFKYIHRSLRTAN